MEEMAEKGLEEKDDGCPKRKAGKSEGKAAQTEDK